MVLSELGFFTCTIHFVCISNNQDGSSYFLPHFYIAERYAVYLTTCLQNIEMASSKLMKFIRNVYQKNYNLNLINLLFSAHATTTNITDLSAFGRCPWYFKHFYNLVELHSLFLLYRKIHVHDMVYQKHSWYTCTKLFARETWYSVKYLVLCSKTAVFVQET